MSENTLVISSDGSHTLLSKQFNVHYHSIHGALEESIHVFISAGLDFLSSKQEINIFEMGFGTGLNAWLACIHAGRTRRKMSYTGIELFPLDEKTVKGLNYTSQIVLNDDEKASFEQLHNLSWDKTHAIHSNFTFKKHHEDIHNFDFKDKYDIIFFDAFAPNTQANLWEKDLHERIFNSLNPGGILVTYCAKGVFKRMLKEIGYTLDPLSGPHRKHEMTRAIKLI